jgi:hypothetical protein
MDIQLTWDDLIIQNLTPESSERWLSNWSSFVEGQVGPMYMSKFGDWFLRHPDGSTSELSVLEGTFSRIADTADGFDVLANTKEWQEEHLLSLLVSRLHERGMIPAEGQCYGFAPHPIISGKIDIETVMVMPIGAWQSICAETFGAMEL